MTQNEKINLVISAKNQASGTLSNLKTQIIGIGTAYLSWRAVSGMMSDIVKKGVETQRVYNLLGQTIKHHGEAWASVEGKVRKFTQSMQELSGVSDEKVAMGLQRLISYGMSTTEALKTMRVATDFAIGSNMDLMAASDLLGKAFVGYTGTLSRYGIILDESIPKAEKFKAAQEKLQEMFGGSAASQMDTMAGKWSLLTERIGDLEETIYKLAEDGGTIDSLTDKLSDAVVGVNAWLSSEMSFWDRLEIYAAGAIGRLDIVADKIKDLSIESQLLSGEFQFIPDEAFEDAINKVEVVRQDLGDFYAEYARLQSEQATIMANEYSRGMKVTQEEWQEANENIVEITDYTQYQVGQIVEEKQKDIINMNNMMVASIANDFIDLMFSTRRTWEQMSADFMKFFLKAVLISVSPQSSFASMFLNSFKFWDVAANDRALINEGRKVGQFIQQGMNESVLRIAPPKIDFNGAGMSASSLTINFNGPVSDKRFIRDTILPEIEKAVVNGRSKLQMRNIGATGTVGVRTI